MGNPWRWAEVETGRSVFTSVTAEEIRTLGDLARDQDCLEVGSGFGFSAVMMARYGAASVTAVDPHIPHPDNMRAETLDILRENVERLAPPGIITIIREPSQVALPALAGRRFGLVFIDADHSYESATHDVTWARELVTGDGWIACHDYGWPAPDVPVAGIDGVNRALDEVFPDGPDRIIGTLHVTKGDYRDRQPAPARADRVR